FAERDVAALVADPLRLHVRAGRFPRRVDVREERDDRHLVLDGRRERGGDVAVVVDRRIVQAELLQLVDEQAQQVELLGGARIGLRVLVRLRVDAGVADEPLGRVLCQLLRGCDARVGGHGGSVPAWEKIERVTAIALGCLSAALFGGMSVGLRIGLDRFPDAELATLATVGGALAVALVFAVAEAPSRGVHAGGAWPFLLAGLMQPGVGQLLVTIAIREAGASRASVVLGSATIALVLLGEPARWPLLLGALLIVGGGVELARDRDRPAHVRRRGYAFAFAATILFSARDNLTRWLAGSTSVPPAVAAAAALAGGFALMLVVLG